MPWESSASGDLNVGKNLTPIFYIFYNTLLVAALLFGNLFGWPYP
jgi:hypothetical protein